jgi:hypothetical protein
MHGGAKGSGAPRGNTNALRHGTFTREAIQRRGILRKQIREAQDLVRHLNASFKTGDSGGICALLVVLLSIRTFAHRLLAAASKRGR